MSLFEIAVRTESGSVTYRNVDANSVRQSPYGYVEFYRSGQLAMLINSTHFVSAQEIRDEVKP